MVREVVQEEKAVEAIKHDVGYDILREELLPSRKPIDFCMSLNSNGLKTGFLND